jgi:insulysin
MANNGGNCNAYTSKTNTNYHFQCSNEAFEEGFDRMSQFFIAPMFSKDSADREVNAVDSEYNMSLQVDAWHQSNLQMSLSHPDSTYHKFMCGNKETLQKEGIRNVLLEFHKKWYSSNIMCVTLNSKNSLEDMTKWVTEKLSPVKNFDVEVPNLVEPAPFTPDTMSKLVRFVPVKDLDEL